jgi:PhzF family phenazine biosynthesis protein
LRAGILYAGILYAGILHNRKMPVPIIQVDAFTDTPFRGNPAAVCLLKTPRDDQWMANVAMEMNLAETAFLVADADDAGAYQLRWFTPAVEVALCGHATLASAHVLWQEGHIARGTAARFHTKSGLLTCTQVDNWIEMDFPATFVQPADPPAQLAEAIGTEFRFVGRSKFDYLVEVSDENTLRGLKPNHRLLGELPVRGVISTALAAAENRNRYDFVSRFFAPGSGIDEDPVTGSAHCSLAPYWAPRIGRQAMTGYQMSSRGGIVKVRHADDRVFLSGQAVTVLRGALETE